MKSVVSRVGQKLRPVGNVDALTNGRIVGWALGRGPVTVEAWIDGERVTTSAPQLARVDVAAAYPMRPDALITGFSLNLPAGAVAAHDIAELEVVARPSSPLLPSSILARVQIAGGGLQEILAEVPVTEIRSPFPRAVTDIVAARWPDDCENLQSAIGQKRFLKRLKQLLATPGINSLPALTDYARYLTVTLAHCRFVERHFPATNPGAREGAPDFHCKPNAVRELFPIIHQLYVLRSNGIGGDFAEFGCFKGYSSAMLSFACERLGVPMHIFDSFEGLPPSEGAGYEAGQYAGSLDEVRENIRRFGAIDAVTFHKGFFADTLPKWQGSDLMCLWMDVDLEASARDLMAVADRLHARGTVFSHECTASIFQDGRIVSPPAPDNPIGPVLARFDDLGRPLTGRYVSGYTGAFWPIDGGVPVVDTDILFELVSAYER